MIPFLAPFFVLSMNFVMHCSNDTVLLKRLTSALDVPAEYQQQLNVPSSPRTTVRTHRIQKRTDNFPLYTAYPQLENAVPSITLCQLPTPVYKLTKASKALGISLFIKREDLSNAEYGGNKNRTLEFFLADAKKLGADAVMTLGTAGSTHCVATAHMARACGFNTMYAELLPHTFLYETRDLLLLLHTYGGTMQFYANSKEREQGILETFLQHKRTHGSFPYFIPAGGSVPLGITGHVNAMFELKDQIKQGVMPEPDYIYVACGSKGTTAGLLLGAKAAGLKTIIVPVCIKEDPQTDDYAESLCILSRKTNDFLCAADPTFPSCAITITDLPLVHICAEHEYGIVNKHALRAHDFLLNKEHVFLDGTYTAKVFAALMHDAQQGLLKGKTVLFWNTYCNHAPVKLDYHQLPHQAHLYFEHAVQHLDKKR